MSVDNIFVTAYVIVQRWPATDPNHIRLNRRSLFPMKSLARANCSHNSHRQKRAFLAPRHVSGGVQINRFGIVPAGLLGNWVADHNGGSACVLLDLPYHSA